MFKMKGLNKKMLNDHEWKVTAQAFDRETGEPVSKKRDEVIDTEKNELFKNTQTAFGIKKGYESFWNELNAPHYPNQVVFVQKVKKLRR
jgi:hypothetical protein